MQLAFSFYRLEPLITRSVFSGVLFYSNGSLHSPKPTTNKRENLYKRISRVAGDPKVSITPILNEWVEEGQFVSKDEVTSIIKNLRVSKRFNHALEISQWMSDWMFFVLSPGDIAVRLGLIFKVHGIEQAEKYFENIPKQSRAFAVYFALLNCYSQNKSVEKAELLMQYMKELGFVDSPHAYNLLLNLYSGMGQYEKFETVIEEMNKRGIRPDKFTCSIQLNVYANMSEIDGMTKILKRMESDPNIIVGWNCYAIAANCYIKAAQIDKALKMLKKSEELITGKIRSAYNFLLTLYAAAGSTEDLYRIWNMYKSSEKVYNADYKCMISSLVKLNDIAGAEKIFIEWELRNTGYDFRVPNLLISAYCKSGLLEKAEMFVSKLTAKGKKPIESTWDILATGYAKANQYPKAVEIIKARFLAGRPSWNPSHDTVAACLVYLKQQGDGENTDEFMRLVGSPALMSTDDCERLTHHTDNKMAEFDAVNQVGADRLDGDEETDELQWMLFKAQNC